MDFVRILRSLEELLYEAMTWLIFYPRTFWRALRRPITMLRYSDRELGDAPEQQFTDMLSPPLFLMLTILLSHVIEVASHQALPRPDNAIGRQIMASDENLLLLRSILFAIYPLLFAVGRLSRQRVKLDLESLRRPFYAQCYIAAPAAFAFGIGSILGRAHAVELQVAGLLVSTGSVVWYVSIEAYWLRIQAKLPRLRAGWLAFRTWLLASLINSVIGFVILGAAA
ncbi:MAG TPA: hypothetical protein VMQ93_19190 [Novosphingobium sp.]|nr:hypothetical protein [Novosphingobium sp.]